MPRRKPESIKEVRYELSLGPKEQPLVNELTEVVAKTNQTLNIVRIGVVVAPLGVALVGYGVYKAGQKLAEGLQNGLASFGFGSDNVGFGGSGPLGAPTSVEEVWEMSGPGSYLKAARKYAEVVADKTGIDGVARAAENGERNMIPIYGPIRSFGKLTGLYDIW
jgi:hypothetical protein